MMTISQSAYRVALLNLLTALVPLAQVVEGKLVGDFAAEDIQHCLGTIGYPGSGVTSDSFTAAVTRVFHSSNSGSTDVGQLLTKLVGTTNGTVKLQRVSETRFAITTV